MNTNFSNPKPIDTSIIRLVYALTGTLLFVFVFVFIFFSFLASEQNEDNIQNKIKKYHMNSIQLALSSIDAIHETHDWFKSFERNSKVTPYMGMHPQDQAENITQLLQANAEIITKTQNKFNDPEFNVIINNINAATNPITKIIKNSTSDIHETETHRHKIISININELFFPLIASYRQLKKMHEINLVETRINNNLLKSGNDIFIFTTMLLLFSAGFITLFLVIKKIRGTIVNQSELFTALRSSDEQIHLLLNSSSEAIYGIDLDGNCTFANEACVRILGYKDPDELLGENMHNLIHHSHSNDTHYPAEECKIYQAHHDGCSIHVNDEVFWKKNGERLPVEYWSNPIIRDHKILGSVINFIDISEKKKDAEILNRKQDTLDKAQEIAHIGSWDWNIQTNELHWSDEIYRIFGVWPQSFEATYDEFLKTIHPDDKQDVIHAVENSVKNPDTPYDIEHRIIRPDGETRIVHEEGVIYRDEDLNPYRMIGTVLDITERRNTEISLANEQAQLQAIINAIPDAIVFVNPDREIVATNPSVEKLLGYAEKELIGKTTQMLYNDSDDYRHQGTNRHSKRVSGSSDAYIIEYRRKNGTVFSGETLGTKVISDNGKVLGFIGLIRDVSERIASEKNLNSFKSTLDMTLDCVFMFDPDTLKFIYTNEGATNQVGYSTEKMLEMTPVDIKPEFDEKTFREKLEPLKSGNTNTLNFETIHRHKDGHDTHVEISLQLVTPTKDAPRYVAMVRDISERRAQENELKVYRTHLETLVNERTKKLEDTRDDLIRSERLATLGKLTATVSHELRNPLGAMRPSLHIIKNKENGVDETHVQQAIERVDRNITRCDHIIDELLDFTRSSEPAIQHIVLDDWITQLLDEQIIPENVIIKRKLNTEQSTIDFDPDRMRRAVINLLENAFHATTAECKKTGKDTMTVTLLTNIVNDKIEIIISDTGSGISSSVLPKVFEPLFSTKGFGVGLGMSIVKQIIEQHHGNIFINTQAGKGTSVTLQFPVKINKGAAA